MFEDFATAIDYAMVIVTARDGDDVDGCLVGFSTQVSIDPERYMVCLSKRNRTYDIALRTTALAVHAISAERRDLADLFGGASAYDVDKLAQVAWHPGPAATALLDDCPVRFIGSVLRTDDWGDHVGFLLAPIPDDGEPNATPGSVLTYQQVRDLKPGREA